MHARLDLVGGEVVLVVDDDVVGGADSALQTVVGLEVRVSMIHAQMIKQVQRT